jgi:dihydrofolate reductase
MGKIVGYIASSLDGYIAGPDGGMDWLEPFQAVEYGYTDFLKSIEIVVMGRLTYEKCLSFGIGWPYPDQDAFIVTSRHIETLPARAQIWNGSISALVTRSRSAKGDAWIVGGSRLQQAVLDADGMDSLDIFIIPILLGDVIPLFLKSDRRHSLHLRHSRQLPMGMMHLVYDVAQLP